MRGERVLCFVAIAMLAGVAGCNQGEDVREQRAQLRVQRQNVVRASEVAQRVGTPRDSGRIIYDAPPPLSAENLARTRAPIVGLDKPLQPGEPAHQPAPPAH